MLSYTDKLDFPTSPAKNLRIFEEKKQSKKKNNKGVNQHRSYR